MSLVRRALVGARAPVLLSTIRRQSSTTTENQQQQINGRVSTWTRLISRKKRAIYLNQGLQGIWTVVSGYTAVSAAWSVLHAPPDCLAGCLCALSVSCLYDQVRVLPALEKDLVDLYRALGRAESDLAAHVAPQQSVGPEFQAKMNQDASNPLAPASSKVHGQ